MRLKNFLIVVKDIEKSRKFYHDLFGLELLLDNGGNMILSEGLVLQEEKYWSFWEKRLFRKTIPVSFILKRSTLKALLKSLKGIIRK